MKSDVNYFVETYFNSKHFWAFNSQTLICIYVIEKKGQDFALRLSNVIFKNISRQTSLWFTSNVLKKKTGSTEHNLAAVISPNMDIGNGCKIKNAVFFYYTHRCYKIVKQHFRFKWKEKKKEKNHMK